MDNDLTKFYNAVKRAGIFVKLTMYHRFFGLWIHNKLPGRYILLNLAIFDNSYVLNVLKLAKYKNNIPILMYDKNKHIDLSNIFKNMDTEYFNTLNKIKI